MFKRNKWLIATANLSITVPDDVLLNVDADDPGSATGMVPTKRNEL